MKLIVLTITFLLPGAITAETTWKVALPFGDLTPFVRRARTVVKRLSRLLLNQSHVRAVNQYSWVLLRAIFGDKWRSGHGKDPIEAFRKRPPTFAGRIKTRKDAQIVMERAKVEWFKMLHKPEK
jgi:hypothetical protein